MFTRKNKLNSDRHEDYVKKYHFVVKYAKCQNDNNNLRRSEFDTKLPACITRLLQLVSSSPSTLARSLNLQLVCIYNTGLTNNIFLTKKRLGTRLIKYRNRLRRRVTSRANTKRGLDYLFTHLHFLSIITCPLQTNHYFVKIVNNPDHVLHSLLSKGDPGVKGG